MAIYGTLDGSIDLMTSSYPSIQPTLDLNFAQTKTLDPRVTFYRDSLGTYTDSSGIIRTVPANVPRFDHNPTTRESLGLLIEESRTNFAFPSVFMGGSGPGSVWTVTPNAAISPDGTSTASQYTWTNYGGAYVVSQNITNSINLPYTASVFIKPNDSVSLSRIQLGRADSAVFVAVTFNHQTKTISSFAVGAAATVNDSSIIPLPNGWYRISVTGTFSASYNNFALLFSAAADNGNIFAWGFQLEQGAFPTSYIPTSGSAVTRSADTAYMDGTNFSSWYNQSEGTFMFNYKRDFTGTVGVNFPGLLSTNSLLIFSNGSSEFIKNLNANAQLSFSGATTNFRKMYVTYSSAGYGGNLDGDAIVTGAQTFGTSDNILNLGVIQGTTIKRFSRIMYYPKRLTDTQLQNLTTL